MSLCENDLPKPYKNVLIINLQKRPDRLVNVYKQLDSINLSDTTIRIKAINSDDAYNYIDKLSDEAFANIIEINNTSIIPNLAALGCATSHMKCWKYMIDNNLDEGIIVEDDIEIVESTFFNFDLYVIKNFISQHTKLQSIQPVFLAINPKIKNDIIIFDNYYEYYHYYNNADTKNYDIIKNKVYKLTKPFTGTYFYYINIHMAKYLLENITKLTYQIDIEIGILAYKQQYSNMFYAYNTDNLRTTNIDTDIQTYIIDLFYLEKCLRDIRNIPKEITNIVYKYLPDIFTIKIDNEI